MVTKQGHNNGPPFTILAGHFPYGSTPDHNMPVYQNPTPSRQAITHQVLSVGAPRLNAQNHIGFLAGAFSPEMASFVVANNNFGTGIVVISLGKYTLTSNVDYVIGASTAATAANIASAIDFFPGFHASVSAGSQVDITYTLGPANQVPFIITYYGTVENFTLVSPDTGEMASGGPNFGSVALI